MKILLLGASGMIGSRILKEAVSRNHQVIAAARDTAKIALSKGVEAVSLDVNDINSVINYAKKADVVISAVSPRNGGDAVKEAEGFTRSLIATYQDAGKRILMVGGASSLQLPDGTSGLIPTPSAVLPEATGMRRAYGMLVDADIDFAVLAPGGDISPGERTNHFRLGHRTMLTTPEGGKSQVSAEDYAVAMLNEVETPAHFRAIFNVAY